MEKVYIICLMRCDGIETDAEFKVAKTKDKAKEVLQSWALEEERVSWIADYKSDEFDYYGFADNYFEVCLDDFKTVIWIEEVEVL